MGMSKFILTEDLKNLVGWCREPLVYKVEEGAIQRFARAVGDDNPLYNDVEFAARSEYGRLMAPPAFVGWPLNSEFDMFKIVEKLIAAGGPRGNLDGGVEYEFRAPIGAGDILICVIRISSIEGKETRLGPTMLTTVESTYTNQRGAVALVARNWFLSFQSK
jgi:acyl dehydratase